MGVEALGNPIQAATKAARGSRKEISGLSIVLRRGTSETSICRATVGETRVDNYLEEGVSVSVRYRDFLIDVDDYRIDGRKVEPSIDDQIEQEIDGVTVTFQAVPLPGSREFRRSDRSGYVWRVHCREVV